MIYFLFSFGKISLVAVVFLDLVKLGQILEHLPEIKSNARPKASTISTTAMFDCSSQPFQNENCFMSDCFRTK